MIVYIYIGYIMSAYIYTTNIYIYTYTHKFHTVWLQCPAVEKWVSKTRSNKSFDPATHNCQNFSPFWGTHAKKNRGINAACMRKQKYTCTKSTYLLSLLTHIPRYLEAYWQTNIALWCIATNITTFKLLALHCLCICLTSHSGRRWMPQC